jgi:hypothetical protein
MELMFWPQSLPMALGAAWLLEPGFWLFLILVVGLPVGWIVWMVRRHKARLGRLAAALQLNWNSADPDRIAGEYRGLRVQIVHRSGGRGEPDRISFTVYADLATLPEIIFRPKRWYHRIAEGVGLSAEARSGDRRFDSRVYVDSPRHGPDDLGLVRVISHAPVQDCLLAILRFHPSEVSVGSDRVTLTFTAWSSWGTRLEPAKASRSLDALIALIEALPVPSPPSDAPPKADRPSGKRVGALFRLGRPAGIFVFIVLLTMFVGPLLAWWGSSYPTLSWDLYRMGGVAAAILLLAFLMVVFVLVRGHSSSHRDFGTFAFCGLIGLPSFCIGLLLIMNGFHYTGARHEVPALVRKVSLSDGKLRLTLAVPFRGQTHRLTIRKDASLRNEFQEGGRITLIIGEGRLKEPFLIGH